MTNYKNANNLVRFDRNNLMRIFYENENDNVYMLLDYYDKLMI